MMQAPSPLDAVFNTEKKTYVHMHPTSLSEYTDGTSWGLSLVPPENFCTFMLKGSYTI